MFTLVVERECCNAYMLARTCHQRTDFAAALTNKAQGQRRSPKGAGGAGSSSSSSSSAGAVAGAATAGCAAVAGGASAAGAGPLPAGAAPSAGPLALTNSTGSPAHEDSPLKLSESFDCQLETSQNDK